MNPRSILVVDDNEDNAEVLALILRARGHVVEVAHDGESALRTAARLQPGFALVDIELPGMDGYEVARRLRKELERPVLVAMTAYGQASDGKRALEAGFEEQLGKPIDMERLLSIIEKP